MYKNGKVNGKHRRYAIYGTARNCSLPRGSWTNWTPITRVISAQLALTDVNVCSFWYFIVYTILNALLHRQFLPIFSPPKNSIQHLPIAFNLHLTPTLNWYTLPSDLHTCLAMRGNPMAELIEIDIIVHTSAHFPHSWTSEYAKFVECFLARFLSRLILLLGCHQFGRTAKSTTRHSQSINQPHYNWFSIQTMFVAT